jgi:DNA-binding LacI/PurR family transcriptional regulator
VRASRFRGTLGYVIPGGGSRFVEPRGEFAGAKQRAKERGYHLDLFDLKQDGLSSRRLAQMLDARGITGVVIAPNYRQSRAVALDWRRLSLVVIGPDLAHLAFDRVNYNTYADTLVALSRVWRAGYRRVGLVIKSDLQRRTEGMMLSAYVGGECLYPDLEFAPPLCCEDPISPETLGAWYRRYRPEVIVSQHWVQTRDATRALGLTIPGDIGFAGVVQVPTEERVSSVYQPFAALGAAAVDLLADQVETGIQGERPHPLIVLLRGRWQDGATLPDLASARTGTPPRWATFPTGIIQSARL